MRFRIAAVFAILALSCCSTEVACAQVLRPFGGEPNRQSAGRRFSAARPVEPVMRVLDANGDGALSDLELRNAAASLRRLDTNRDGRLTADEFRRSRPAAAAQDRSSNVDQAEAAASRLVDQWVEKILTMDDDGNGYLKLEELPENLHSLMSGDTNYDGQLSRSELSSVLEREFRRRGLIRSNRPTNNSPPGRDVARRPLRPETEGE